MFFFFEGRCAVDVFLIWVNMNIRSQNLMKFQDVYTNVLYNIVYYFQLLVVVMVIVLIESCCHLCLTWTYVGHNCLSRCHGLSVFLQPQKYSPAPQPEVKILSLMHDASGGAKSFSVCFSNPFWERLSQLTIFFGKAFNHQLVLLNSSS